MRTGWAALQLLAELDLPVAPRLPGADAEATFRTWRRECPFGSVQAGSPEAVRGLRAFAESTGTLHAGTLGREDGYSRRRADLGLVDPGLDRRASSPPRTGGCSPTRASWEWRRSEHRAAA